MTQRIVNGLVVDMTAEEAVTWQEEQAAFVPPPPPPYRVYKSTFVSRMTEAEIEQMAARLATENVKYREMYAACDYFVSDDPLFAVLHWTVMSELGEPRADELLAPEA